MPKKYEKITAHMLKMMLTITLIMRKIMVKRKKIKMVSKITKIMKKMMLKKERISVKDNRKMTIIMLKFMLETIKKIISKIEIKSKMLLKQYQC